jgi:hypothetical protein
MTSSSLQRSQWLLRNRFSVSRFPNASITLQCRQLPVRGGGI